MIDYVVQPGDCLSSIAAAHGMRWQTVWDHSANAALKQHRGNPNILYPGDVIRIPDIESKDYSRPVDARHRFKVRRQQTVLRVVVMIEGQPVRNAPYTLQIGQETHTGSTNGEGKIEHDIQPTVHRATLRVILPAEMDEYKKLGLQYLEYELMLGELDPAKDDSDSIAEAKGLQQRLRNLGFYFGNIDGDIGTLSCEAVRQYRQSRGDDDPDDAPARAVKDDVKSIHGC